MNESVCSLVVLAVKRNDICECQKYVFYIFRLSSLTSRFFTLIIVSEFPLKMSQAIANLVDFLKS